MSTEVWEFYLDARGLWCWRRVDAARRIVSDSKRCFPTRDQCVADAVANGFVTKPGWPVRAAARSRRPGAARTLRE